MTYEKLLLLVLMLAAVTALLASAVRPRVQPARVVVKKHIGKHTGQRFVAAVPPGAGDGPA